MRFVHRQLLLLFSVTVLGTLSSEEKKETTISPPSVSLLPANTTRPTGKPLQRAVPVSKPLLRPHGPQHPVKNINRQLRKFYRPVPPAALNRHFRGNHTNNAPHPKHPIPSRPILRKHPVSSPKQLARSHSLSRASVPVNNISFVPNKPSTNVAAVPLKDFVVLQRHTSLPHVISNPVPKNSSLILTKPNSREAPKTRRQPIRPPNRKAGAPFMSISNRTLLISRGQQRQPGHALTNKPGAPKAILGVRRALPANVSKEIRRNPVAPAVRSPPFHGVRPSRVQIREPVTEVDLNEELFALFRRLNVSTFFIKTEDGSLRAHADKEKTWFVPVPAVGKQEEKRDRLQHIQTDDLQVIVSAAHKENPSEPHRHPHIVYTEPEHIAPGLTRYYARVSNDL